MYFRWCPLCSIGTAWRFIKFVSAPFEKDGKLKRWATYQCSGCEKLRGMVPADAETGTFKWEGKTS